MWQEDRHQKIKALLATLHRVSTERIMAELGVSRETVRRDLVDLDALGEIRRIHGGAIAVDDEAPIAERAQTRIKFKTAIARAAAKMVASGQTIFIDAGTTTTLLADEIASLANLKSLTIVTNSIDVATRARGAAQQTNRENQVILVGGILSNRALATVGGAAVAEIQRYHADLALLSPVAINRQYGATNFDHAETDVARAMVNNAAKVVILADYSKIGQHSRVSYCTSERIDVLITNKRASEIDALSDLKEAVSDLVLV